MRYRLRALTIFFFLLYQNNSYAGAWLADPGTYKYYGSFGFVDKDSQKKQKRRGEMFLYIDRLIYKLKLTKNDIIREAQDDDRPLRNSEIREIETIDDAISKLQEEFSMLPSFADKKMANFEVEYGINDTQSFGAKIAYQEEEFVKILTKGIKNETKAGKSVDVFYKHKLYSNDNFVITAQPTFHYAQYNKTNRWQFFDIALLVGHSFENSKQIINFEEIGVSVRQYVKKDAKNNKMGFTIHTIEGLQFPNGIILSNYLEYEKTNLANLVYLTTFYHQVSIAKLLDFDNAKIQNLTIQAGYFWKYSIIDPKYTISGPTFSLYFNL